MTVVGIDSIDELLPQTQCRRCGYPSCRDYATALAQGRTSINRCPPGGDATIRSLASLLAVDQLPLATSCGVSRPLSVAFIDEGWCIGCTICIKVCPVDAIVGAAKLMHTVLAAQCTGCELCVQPCPMGCIEMLRVADHPQRSELPEVWTPALASLAKQRYFDRQARLIRAKQTRSMRAKRTSLRHTSRVAKKLAIAQSVARVSQRQATITDGGAN